MTFLKPATSLTGLARERQTFLKVTGKWCPYIVTVPEERAFPTSVRQRSPLVAPVACFDAVHVARESLNPVAQVQQLVQRYREDLRPRQCIEKGN
jgi:hypothetical protein